MPPPATSRTLPTIMVAGVPRSGTSWIGEIINSAPNVAYRFQPLFAYATTGRVDEQSDADGFRNWFQSLLVSDDAFLLQTEQRVTGAFPLFEKTAPPLILAFKEVRYLYVLRAMLERVPETKLVAIVRHPCAVLASWFRAPRESPAGSDPVTDWRFATAKNAGRPSEFFGFARWREAAELFLQLAADHPQRVVLVNYNRFSATPLASAQALFAALDLPWSEQTESFLHRSSTTHREDTYAVFRQQGIENDWRALVPAPVSDAISRELRGTNLEAFLA